MTDKTRVTIILITLILAMLLQTRDKEGVVTPSNSILPSITNSVKPSSTPLPIIITPEATQPISRGGERYIDTFKGCITMYTEGYKSCGKYPSNPEYGITASGKRVKAEHTVAMDKKIPFGTLIKIEGFDDIVFEVEDRGSAITGNDVDVYIPEYPDGEKLADIWGIQYRQVWVLQYRED